MIDDTARIRTQSDIAKALGVSQVTVHKALTNQSGVSPQLRRRVLEMAAQGGYRVHAGARAMRRGRAGSVTLVLSAAGGGRSVLPEAVLRGAADELEAAGMHLAVAYLDDAKLTSNGYVPRMLREFVSDGLLINYNKLVPPRMIELIDSYRLPAVWLNHKRPTDAAYPDDLSGGAEAVGRLTALGHSRIAYVGYSYAHEVLHYSELDRREGYCRAMEQAGLAPLTIDRYTHDGDRIAYWQHLLNTPGRPTAVIAYSITSLVYVVRAADRLGLSIPGDLSVVLFGQQTAFAGQDIATMLVPDQQVGREGAKLLLAKLKQPAVEQPSAPVRLGFDAGQSIGPLGGRP
jgi:LacI family transcriptional regulator